MAELTVDEFNKGIGAIVKNFQAIETTIRFFFFRKVAEQEPFPNKCGEDYVPSTSLTTYCQLRKWIRRYNSNLTKEERVKYEVSEDNAEIRDTIAHGRLIAPDPPTLPYTMWKFGEAVDDRVTPDGCGCPLTVVCQRSF
jgi:hypothetical protein